MTLLKEQCISISDFRQHTKKYLKLSNKYPIYLFSNNILVGKLIHPDAVVGDDYNFHITFEPGVEAGELLNQLREADNA